MRFANLIYYNLQSNLFFKPLQFSGTRDRNMAGVDLCVYVKSLLSEISEKFTSKVALKYVNESAGRLEEADQKYRSLYFYVFNPLRKSVVSQIPLAINSKVHRCVN